MADTYEEEKWYDGMKDSYNRMSEQFVKDGQNQWTVPSANDYGNSTKNHWEATVESTGQAIMDDLGAPLLNVGSGTLATVDNVMSISYNISKMGDYEQYADLLDASCASALDYLTEKIDRIRTLWNTMVPVSVGTLLDEIAPFATNWDVALNTLGKKTSNMIAYLLDIDMPQGDSTSDAYLDLAKNLGEDALDGLIDNPEFEEALGNLNIVKAFADGLGAISTAITVAKEAMKFLEPWAPTIELAKDLIDAWRNPQSGVEAGIIASKMTWQFLYDTYRLGMKYARNLLFNMKFNVPMLLVGSLGNLSVKSAVEKFNYNETGSIEDFSWSGEALAMLFEDDFYDTTYLTPEWTQALSDLEKFQMDAVNSTYINENLSKYGAKGYGQRLLAKTATKVMDSASQRARKVAHVPDFSGIGMAEWQSPSEYLKTVTRDRYYNTPTNYFTGSIKDIDPSLSPVNDEESIQRFSFTDKIRG